MLERRLIPDLPHYADPFLIVTQVTISSETFQFVQDGCCTPVGGFRQCHNLLTSSKGGKSNGEGGGNSDSAELNHDESMANQTRILRVV